MSELLTGDLYQFEALLDEDDREVLERVRAFLDTEVRPIANDYWGRAEFPHQLIKASPAWTSPGWRTRCRPGSRSAAC